MKTSQSHSGNITRNILLTVLFCLLNKFTFSSTLLHAKPSILNIELIIPVVCVLILGAFLLTAFIKQKNH